VSRFEATIKLASGVPWHIDEMAEHLRQTGADKVLVTTADGVLIGLLRRSDVDGALLASEGSGKEEHTHERTH
jgi:hypothetical protein